MIDFDSFGKFADVAKPCGAAGRWFVTPHAVRQFAERALRMRLSNGPIPDKLHRKIVGLIARDSEGAHMLKQLRRDGCEMWRGPKPRRLRYVVDPRGFGLPVLVTVLPTFDEREVFARVR